MISYYIERDGFLIGQGNCQKEAIDSINTEGGVLTIGTPPPGLQWPTVPKTYATLRRDAYPPLSEFADAIYWQNRGDGSKMTQYLQAIDRVKAEYPKVPTT